MIPTPRYSIAKRILAEADSAHESGAIGALLRREGLYSSHLTHWRQQRDLFDQRRSDLQVA